MDLRQENEYLKLEVQKLKAERARMAKALQETSRHGRRIQRAYEDALLLAMWHCSGIIPSRRYARLHKFTQNRWESATALLRMARIIVGHRRWMQTDLATIEKRLEQAKQRALESREAFFSRLNTHHTRGHIR
jgi:hypothetical protein